MLVWEPQISDKLDILIRSNSFQRISAQSRDDRDCKFRFTDGHDMDRDKGQLKASI